MLQLGSRGFGHAVQTAFEEGGQANDFSRSWSIPAARNSLAKRGGQPC